MRFIWRNHKSGGATKHITIHRFLPREWRQTHSERENWHAYRNDHKARHEQSAPMVRLDKFLTDPCSVA